MACNGLGIESKNLSAALWWQGCLKSCALEEYLFCSTEYLPEIKLKTVRCVVRKSKPGAGVFVPPCEISTDNSLDAPKFNQSIEWGAIAFRQWHISPNMVYTLGS